MSNETGAGLRTVYRVLDKFKNEGKLERVGGKRYGHWEVLK